VVVEMLRKFMGRILVLLFALIVIALSSCNDVSCESESFVYREENLTITAQLLQNGSFGDSVSYQNVEFFDETCNLYLGSVQTDWNGYASLEWMVPWNHPLGITIFNVTYRGNDSLSLWPSFQQASVIVLSRTEMDVECENEAISPGDNLVIDVQLNRDDGEFIVGETVSVFHSQTQLAEIRTNTSGFASFSIPCNNTWAALGLNVVRIVYARNLTSYNEAVNKTIEFIVSKVSTSIELHGFNRSIFHLNETVTLEIRSFADNYVLPGVQLDLLLDEKELGHFQTNESGVGMPSFLIDSSVEIGSHIFIVRYNGTERLATSLLEIQFLVVSEISFDVALSDLAVIDVTVHIGVRVYDYFHRNVTDFAVALVDEISGKRVIVSAASGKNCVDFYIQMTPPKGRRRLILTIEDNPFVRNGICMIPLDVWTNPSIAVVESSVEGYAYLGQTVELKVLIRDYSYEYPNRSIRFMLDNGLSSVTKVTDDYGVSALRITLPTYECQYNIEIAYNGSKEDYELSSKLEYFIMVSCKIPVGVVLIKQNIVAPLREMQVSLLVIGMNGSPLEDSTVILEWLDIERNQVTSQIGIIDISLSMPEFAGIYNLSYRIEESEFLSLSEGVIGIIVSLSEAMSSQGAGLPMIASSLSISIGLAAIPLLRRKYLIA
jgi:hypothetical protein